MFMRQLLYKLAIFLILMSVLSMGFLIFRLAIFENEDFYQQPLKTYSHSIAVVSENISMINVVLRDLQKINVSVSIYSMRELEKAFEKNYIMFLSDAIEKISGDKDLVKRIILSGKTLIFVDENPLSKIFRNFTSREIPLTVLPIKEISGGCVKENISRCIVIGETEGRKTIAVAIKIDLYPNISRYPVTYIGFGPGFEGRYESILTYVIDYLEKSSLNNRTSGIYMKNYSHNLIPIVYAQNYVQSPYPWSLVGQFVYVDSYIFTDTLYPLTVRSEYIIYFGYGGNAKDPYYPYIEMWHIFIPQHRVKIDNGILPRWGLWYWVDMPNRMFIDVSLFSDQEILIIYPGVRTANPPSISISYSYPTSISITASASNPNIVADITTYYSYSGYYNRERMYAVEYLWGHDPGFLNIGLLKEGYMYSYSEIGSLPPLVADVKIRGVGVQITRPQIYVHWIEHYWRFYIHNTSYTSFDYGTSTG
jgi:hypothetical protein